MSEQAHRLVVTPARIRVGDLVFGSRYPLAGSTVAMKPHLWAEREQKREERKQREAQMKGHKKLPTALPYFRRSFHVMLETNGGSWPLLVKLRECRIYSSLTHGRQVLQSGESPSTSLNYLPASNARKTSSHLKA
jgi:hypothetical protein